jgi:MFS family permease
MVILIIGIGMIAGGALADRAAHSDGRRKLRLAAVYTFASFAFLATAFALQAGPLQMGLLSIGALFAGAPAGIVVATVVDVTDPRLRATVIATVALFNNLLGLAPAPYLVGLLSDAINLRAALSIVTMSGLAASLCFVLAARSYVRERTAFLPGQGPHSTATV